MKTKVQYIALWFRLLVTTKMGNSILLVCYSCNLQLTGALRNLDSNSSWCTSLHQPPPSSPPHVPLTDEEFGGDIEIPEEMQTQLLEDYQRECEENGKKKTDTSNGQTDSQHKAKVAADIQTTECDKAKSSLDDTKSKSGVDSAAPELMEELKVDLTKTSEIISKPSPSSTGNLCFHIL